MVNWYDRAGKLYLCTEWCRWINYRWSRHLFHAVSFLLVLIKKQTCHQRRRYNSNNSSSNNNDTRSSGIEWQRRIRIFIRCCVCGVALSCWVRRIEEWNTAENTVEQRKRRQKIKKWHRQMEGEIISFWIPFQLSAFSFPRILWASGAVCIKSACHQNSLLENGSERRFEVGLKWSVFVEFYTFKVISIKTEHFTELCYSGQI